MSKIIRLISIITLFLVPFLVLAQSAAPALTRSLSLGAQGNDVKSLQEFLARDTKIYPEGLATGYFGLKTQEAVKRWQQKYGIDAVGIVGPKTIAKIKEVSQSVPEKPAQTTTATPSTTATTPEATVPATPTAPADVTPPTATLEIRPAAPTNVYIKFIPSEEVIATYEYGLTVNYGSAKEASNQYSSSAVGMFLDNLTFSSTYQIRVKVTDRAGNIGYSKNYTFTTPGFSQAPVVSYGPVVVPSSATPATAVAISWSTNIPCTGILRYDASTSLGNSKNSGYNTDHSVVLTGLGSGATYVARIDCYTAKEALNDGNNFTFVATGTNSSSAISNPFLANIFKLLNEVVQKFRVR